MINNQFFSDFKLNKRFSLKDDKIVGCNIEISKQGEKINCLDKIEKKEAEIVLVQAFSNEPNINYYESLLKNERDNIIKGINSLKALKNDMKIKVLVNKKTEGIAKEIFGENSVIKIKEKDLLNKSTLISKVIKGEEANKNILVEDLLSVLYIGEEEGKESSEVILTVFGDIVNENKIFKITYGTTVGELLNHLNGNEEELEKVVAGGVFTGECIYDLNKVIEPGTKSLVFFGKKSSEKPKEVSCIRCSKCLRKCPQGLNPIKLKEAWDKKNALEFKRLGGENCIDCGLCSYTCPSNIELAHNIKSAKTYINKIKE